MRTMMEITKHDDVVSAELDAIARSTDLCALEKIVRNGKRTFLEVGTALWRIRGAKLYKATHSSWESWCADSWYGSKRHADRQIAAVRIAKELGQLVPTAVDQVRPLAALPPEERREAWAEAVETAPGGVLTAAHVQAVVERKQPPRLQTRRTPRWFFDELNRRFGPFHLDAFASKENALCEDYLTQEQDGCRCAWADVTFGNPEFEDMAGPLEQAVRQAKAGIRSVVLGPVGCSQEWYHQLAIRGTIFVPDHRINFDLPDGTPTDRADRDTIVMCFGCEFENKAWRLGSFRVERLELGDVMPRKTTTNQESDR